MTNWHTLVRHLCECGNTYPNKLSVKLCVHDNLGEKAMPRAPKNGAPTKTKPAAKKAKVAKRKPAKKKTKVS